MCSWIINSVTALSWSCDFIIREKCTDFLWKVCGHFFITVIDWLLLNRYSGKEQKKKTNKLKVKYQLQTTDTWGHIFEISYNFTHNCSKYTKLGSFFQSSKIFTYICSQLLRAYIRGIFLELRNNDSNFVYLEQFCVKLYEISKIWPQVSVVQTGQKTHSQDLVFLSFEWVLLKWTLVRLCRF